MMDVVKSREVHTVVIMASSQVGKTEILKNTVGYYVDKEPCPILLVQPTLEVAEAWSKDRLKPMVRDTPALKDKIKIQSRDGDNTILHKTFRGGHITMAGANSPASLASRPVRVLLLDEVDRYPQSAGEEGDPVNLAKKRTTAFWNRKTIMCSTPTIKDQSRIEAAYKTSDMRVYEVPCPHCGVMDVLRFANINRPYDDAPAEEWEYICPHCGVVIDESHKMPMLRAGKWRATAPFKGTAGFYINELYSPWVAWKEMVANFLEAKKLPETLKTFVNTSLAETWDPHREGEGLDAETIQERTEPYPAQVPEGVLLLTASVDVQDDRLECEVLGWGIDRETWSIDHRVIYGDPATSDVWVQLNDLLLAEYQHERGVTMKITISVIDAGGHHTEDVYRYVQQKAREKRRIYAVRGHSMRGQPIFAKVSRNNNYRVKVFYVGTDTAKEMIYSYLAIDHAGAGYMHHPDTYDEAYFEQLTAERKMMTYDKGRSITKWLLPSGKRNEALDLKVYNFAAYAILKPDMAMVRARFEMRCKKLAEQSSVKELKKSEHNEDAVVDDRREEKPPVIRKTHVSRRKRGGFVKNY
jgi:phage terminase large subunit GpA-like protein